MDNSSAIVPYHDPFDDSTSSLFQVSFLDYENPTIDDLPTTFISDADPFLHDCSNYLFENSYNNGEGGFPGTNYCQILREITHSDGLQILKLEIYGTLGKISHAVLEKSSQSHEYLSYQTFDFSNDSTSSVKQFLVQYFEACRREGCIVLEDQLCDFYEALGVGSDFADDCLDIDSLLQFSPTTSRDFQVEQQEMMNESDDKSSVVRHEKIPLSAQRERTGKLKLRDFAGYLHLPIEAAAKELNICPTVMKKICRRDGLSRWPYRKIKSITRKISEREKSLLSNDVEERASAKANVEKLEQELANIFEAFTN